MNVTESSPPVYVTNQMLSNTSKILGKTSIFTHYKFFCILILINLYNLSLLNITKFFLL